MIPRRVALPAVMAGTLGNQALGFALFGMPATLADAEPWGFLPDGFAEAAGGLTYGRTEAWWVGFRRMEEGCPLLSVAPAVGFAGHALRLAGCLLARVPKSPILLNPSMLTGRGALLRSRKRAIGGLSGGMMGMLGITAVGIGAIGFELGRRRRQG